MIMVQPEYTTLLLSQIHEDLEPFELDYSSSSDETYQNSQTKHVDLYTTDHITYGPLLKGIRFLNQDLLLIVEAGEMDDAKMRRVTLKPEQILHGVKGYRHRNFPECFYFPQVIIGNKNKL